MATPRPQLSPLDANLSPVLQRASRDQLLPLVHQLETEVPEYNAIILKPSNGLRSQLPGGLAQAQFEAALQYETGDGAAQNWGRAFELYRSAALTGYSPAQDNLGHMYEKGEGIAKNLAAAVDSMRKCARKRA